MRKTKILEQYDKQKKLYECFAEEIQRLLNKLVKQENISCNAITGRVKERASLEDKIERKEKYTDINDITDIVGIRLITYYAEDVDKIAMLIENEFLIDKENSIDKRKALEPDRFGYCSVHYVVGLKEDRLGLKEYNMYEGLKCEIQIRTILQHAWAEIEHDMGYKSEIVVPKEVKRNFSRLAGLLEIADNEFQQIRTKIENYKIEIENNIMGAKIETTLIDAVSVEMLIVNDKDIRDINDKILSAFSNVKFNEEVHPSEYEIVIKYLNYFDIHTLNNLLELIEKRKEYSLKIVERIASVMNEKGEKEHHFSRTAALLYVCYAELLSITDNQETVEDFLKIKLGKDKSFCKKMARFLLAVKNDIK